MQPEIIKSKIPEQYEGAESNNEVTKEFPSEDEAKLFYLKALKKMKDINHWEKIAGILSAAFTLCDKNGHPKNSDPEEDDLLKISIPGPGNSAGDGYDWVRIEKIREISDGQVAEMLIRVRPCENPETAEHEIAHFFDESASSSFVISRSGKTVKAGIYGRNEKPNTDPPDLLNKTRNIAVAGAAASLFSKIQWKSLVEGWME